MAEYIEGKHAVTEALVAGVPLTKILIATGIQNDKGIDQIKRLAQSNDVRVEYVKRAWLDNNSSVHGAHQGVMAQARPFKYKSLGDLLKDAEGKKNALIVVLDHVTDAGNLGAIIRSAEVVGATGVLIPNARAAQVTPLTYKASAGAVNYLPIAREANLTTCLKRCKDEGFWVVGASEHATETIWNSPLEGRIVLVMGSEGSGISRLVLENCDVLTKLPQVGRVESLNVAQATTAVMYEWMRRCSE